MTAGETSSRTKGLCNYFGAEWGELCLNQGCCAPARSPLVSVGVQRGRRVAVGRPQITRWLRTSGVQGGAEGRSPRETARPPRTPSAEEGRLRVAATIPPARPREDAFPSFALPPTVPRPPTFPRPGCHHI